MTNFGNKALGLLASLNVPSNFSGGYTLLETPRPEICWIYQLSLSGDLLHQAAKLVPVLKIPGNNFAAKCSGKIQLCPDEGITPRSVIVIEF